MSAKQQTKLVANFIVDHCPEEIGTGGAGELAVRLMSRMAISMQQALEVLREPGYPTLARVALVIDHLRRGLGAWK